MPPLFGSLFSEAVPILKEDRNITIYRDGRPPLKLEIKYPLTAMELAELIAMEFDIPKEWPQFYFEGEHLDAKVCLLAYI